MSNFPQAPEGSDPQARHPSGFWASVRMKRLGSTKVCGVNLRDPSQIQSSGKKMAGAL
jgi:hypothetical protein